MSTKGTPLGKNLPTPDALLIKCKRRHIPDSAKGLGKRSDRATRKKI